jgi:hypothetical protein
MLISRKPLWAYTQVGVQDGVLAPRVMNSGTLERHGWLERSEIAARTNTVWGDVFNPIRDSRV